MLQFIKCLALILLFSGCQLLRKSRTENVSQHAELLSATDVVEQEIFNQDYESSMRLVSHDSSAVSRRILIRPKGKFKFSADSGFVGNAVEISIAETRESVAQKIQNVQERTSLKDSAMRKLSTTDKLTTTNKTKNVIRSPGVFATMIFALLILSIMALGAYWLWRK